MAKTILTNKMALEIAIALVNGTEYALPKNVTMEEVSDKLGKMKAQVEKKASSKASKIDENLVAEVFRSMKEVDEPLTVGGMIENFVCLADMKSQKVTPIVTKLVKDGKLDIVTVKGRNHYVLAE